MSNVLRSIASRITTHHLVAAKPTSPDSNSKFLKGADIYSLLMLSKNPAKMVIEIKGLDGSRLDQKCMNESGPTILLTKTTRLFIQFNFFTEYGCNELLLYMTTARAKILFLELSEQDRTLS